MPDAKHKLHSLFQPIDIMPLVFFRVMFGVIMLWEVWRYFYHDRIVRYFIEPQFYFHYYGFTWVQPLAGDSMIWLFYGLGILAICILVGLFYRVTITIFWILFTYIFLIDQTQYLNHFYLISLISFLMIWIPTHCKWSLDAMLQPKTQAETAPAWSLWLLRGQMAIVYVYGGIAKINSDWLRGEPMRDWLSSRMDFPLIGQWFTQEWMVYGFSYGGLFFDLLIVPALLWRRTRWLAVGLMLCFHATNHMLFNIGIFPHFAVAITLLFLPPHWFRLWQQSPNTRPKSYPINPQRVGLLVVLSVYFLLQVLLPLRHFLYPGYVSWTEEGHNLAWHMKLRSKDGDVEFYAVDPDVGIIRRIPIENYLNERQIEQMADHPPMILRFAHFLSNQDTYSNHGIYVWSMMSLNGRGSQLLIDPTANLAHEPDDLWHDDWILPLYQAPAPSETTPTLLISRRDESVLTFINMTESPFPLGDLILTTNGYEISGDDFGVDMLESDACVIVHETGIDMTRVLPICNEAGSRFILLAQAIKTSDSLLMTVNTDYILDCIHPHCIVTYHGD